MEQRVPIVNEDDVERVVRREFPAASVEGVLRLLATHGVEQQPQSARVRLAALKLAGGSVERLKVELDQARQDRRDVVGAAEYPEYLRHYARIDQLSRDEVNRMISADWEQHREWLTRQP